MSTTAIPISNASCPQGYSHRLMFGSGARFCPGCLAPLEHAEPAPRPLGPPPKPYTWSDPAVVPLGAGDGSDDADTSQDGLRRFIAWRDHVVGVVDTVAGPLAIVIHLNRPARTAGGQGASPVAPSAAQPQAAPEIRTLLLEAIPRRPGRPLSNAQVEPLIVQGLALVPLKSRVLAIDLCAEELTAVPVLTIEKGEAFAGCLHQHGEELLAVIRGPAGPRVVVLQPARDETGVLSLKAPWGWKAAPAEAPEGTFGPVPFTGFRRAMFVGDAVFIPGRDAILVATLTPYGRERQAAGTGGGGSAPAPGDGTPGEAEPAAAEPAAAGARWVWKRQALRDGHRVLAEPRFHWALGDAVGAAGIDAPVPLDDDGYNDDDSEADGGYAPVTHAGPAAAQAVHGVSAGILVKGLDAGDEPAWSLLRPEADGRLAFRRYPETEVIVANGRIYAVARKSHLTELHEADDVGGPKSSRVTVTGAVVDRLLAVRDDLLVLVRDGQALKVWAYNVFGTLRGQDEGGQKLLGEGESLTPPILTEDRVVCVWTDSRQIYAACATLPPR